MRHALCSLHYSLCSLPAAGCPLPAIFSLPSAPCALALCPQIAISRLTLSHPGIDTIAAAVKGNGERHAAAQTTR